MLHEEFVNTALDSTEDTVIDTTNSASDIATTVIETANRWSFDIKSAAIGALMVVGVQIAYNNIPKLVNKFKSNKKNDEDFDFDDDDDDDDVIDEDDIVDVDDIEIVRDENGNAVAAVKEPTETPSNDNRATRRKKNKNRG